MHAITSKFSSLAIRLTISEVRVCQMQVAEQLSLNVFAAGCDNNEKNNTIKADEGASRKLQNLTVFYSKLPLGSIRERLLVIALIIMATLKTVLKDLQKIKM